MKIKTLVIAVLALVLGYAGFSALVGSDNRLASTVKSMLPVEAKQKLRETVFVFRNQALLKEQLQQAEDELVEAREQLQLTHNRLAYTEQLLSKTHMQFAEFREFADIRFNRRQRPMTFDIGGTRYRLDLFTTESLFFGKRSDARGTSYVHFYDGRLFLATGTGRFAWMEADALQGDTFTMRSIATNIRELVTYDAFYRKSRLGIKDLLIHDDRLYASFSNQVKPGCFNTSVLVAELDLRELVFREFYNPGDCVAENNDYGQFDAHHAGGRMVPYGDQLLLTMGEYKYRDHAQDPDSPFGKVLALDSDGQVVSVISLGHRNPQGLLYDAERHEVVTTEHGPSGGDEVNINNQPGNEPENYGWPVASYGEHYGFDARDDAHPVYQVAPLHKSHADHGFVEPLMHFTPSIAISEIVQVPAAFNNLQGRQYLVGAMGQRVKEGDRSLHLLRVDDDLALLSHDILAIDERIRDIVYAEALNAFVLFLETRPTIGLLTATPLATGQ